MQKILTHPYSFPHKPRVAGSAELEHACAFSNHDGRQYRDLASEGGYEDTTA
jgi:hypothetical protein